MTRTVSYETKRLSPAFDALAEFQGTAPDPRSRHAHRLLILEATAAALGGFEAPALWAAAGRDEPSDACDLLRHGEALAQLLRERVAVHPTLALATLAAPDLSSDQKRRQGVYYTDSRLARYVARRLSERLVPGSLWLDPAAGTGILLAAAVLEASGTDPALRDAFLTHSVHAADMSEHAVRGARLTLASLTGSSAVVEALHAHVRTADSLLGRMQTWHDRAPGGFDVLIGNPPWERLKVSRHEFLLASGQDRHYGAAYEDYSETALREIKGRLAHYITRATHGFAFQGAGEADLYKCFIELAFQLGHEDSAIGFLIPAGLIRSQGTHELRRFLMERCQALRIDVLDNRARFFAIDTRTKFLTLTAFRGQGPAPVKITHARGTPDGVKLVGTATISASALRKVRPDLSVPEVRSHREWKLFQHAFATGDRLSGEGTSPWDLEIVREVDMTNHRSRFHAVDESDGVPVIEGRMVHQFHFGAKAYVDGEGRRARWQPQPPVGGTLRPQFRIDRHALPPRAAGRVDQLRIGFCDITGQTNERTLLAAMVPAGVVCGNKVPTITLRHQSGDAEDRAWLWLALANSLPFDWLLRRVITTTVNFFLLKGMVFPRLDSIGDSAEGLAQRARHLSGLGPDGSTDPWSRGALRAWNDAATALAFGFSMEDYALILDDFSLLDRGQPAIHGETRSTITRDLTLLSFARQSSASSTGVEELQARVDAARDTGAAPYIPSQFVGRTPPDAVRVLA